MKAGTYKVKSMAVGYNTEKREVYVRVVLAGISRDGTEHQVATLLLPMSAREEVTEFAEALVESRDALWPPE